MSEEDESEDGGADAGAGGGDDASEASEDTDNEGFCLHEGTDEAQAN